MTSPEVVVVNYGMGNLISVSRALDRCGARVVLTDDPNRVESADRLVLPGVGAFSDGMQELCRNGLSDSIFGVASAGKPLLGICLGMQMLFDSSLEFGDARGLGLITGEVVPIPRVALNGSGQKIPHIGWNLLVPPSSVSSWEGTILEGVRQDEAVYFVHSFMANPNRQSIRIADSIYGGHKICAAVGSDNIWGCQFHPEKSGSVGLKVIERFLKI